MARTIGTRDYPLPAKCPGCGKDYQAVRVEVPGAAYLKCSECCLVMRGLAPPEGAVLVYGTKDARMRTDETERVSIVWPCHPLLHAAKHFDHSALRCLSTLSLSHTCPFAFSVC